MQIRGHLGDRVGGADIRRIGRVAALLRGCAAPEDRRIRVAAGVTIGRQRLGLFEGHRGISLAGGRVRAADGIDQTRHAGLKPGGIAAGRHRHAVDRDGRGQRPEALILHDDLVPLRVRDQRKHAGLAARIGQVSRQCGAADRHQRDIIVQPRFLGELQEDTGHARERPDLRVLSRWMALQIGQLRRHCASGCIGRRWRHRSNRLRAR